MSPESQQGTGIWRAVACALTSLFSAAVCMALAGHHPLSVWGALVACLVVAVLAFRTPLSWPIWLLAVLPVAGLATWTGWLTFEESDLLVLAAASGGYGYWALNSVRGPRREGAALTLGSLACAALLIAYGCALSVGAWRGVVDAGGFEWGWWQGYHQPMNSIRLAKALPMAGLLLPLWVMARNRAPERASRGLVQGMTGMLAVVGLMVLWERLAFTGLLNFSTDYRTTALFWEMHVGGAALDACLAMTFPFACQAVLQAKTNRDRLLGVIAVGLGTYACVTTFSRIVFLAVPLGLAVMWGLRFAQQRRAGVRQQRSLSDWMAATLLVFGFALAAFTVFPGSGYRGMLALISAFSLLLPLTAILRGTPRRLLAMGAGLGVALVALDIAVSLLLPKGAYLIQLLSALGMVIALWQAMRSQTHRPGSGLYANTAALALYAPVVASVPMVALHWGGESALLPGLVAAALLFIAAGCIRILPRTPWPVSLVWQGGVMGSMAVVTIVVGALSGGAYLSERFSASDSDASARVDHWRQSLALLRSTSDWTLGKGVGRFVTQKFHSGRAEDQTGDYRLQKEDANGSLLLTGGKHILGWGEMLRMSQRTGAPSGPVTVSLDVRTVIPVGVHLELCEKHLLYNGACLEAHVSVQETGGRWQSIQAKLNGEMPTRGHWYAPALISFSMAVETSGGRVEIDNVSVQSTDGQEMLKNGDFSQGLAHWYFSSDRHHLPWHAKSWWAHVLVEQGLLGLALLGVIVLTAMWRLAIGGARTAPLAPALAAALIGVMTVGLVDSLLDIPRVALLLYLLVGLSLYLPSRGAAKAQHKV